MTDIAHILERYTMQLEPAPQGKEQWFLDYVLRSPRQAGIHLSAGWHALNDIREVYGPLGIADCVEYFGGMGAQALMVNELFGPKRHVVGEYSDDAVAHLKRVMPKSVTVRRADAYLPITTQRADLVVLDFGDLTAWKTREGEQHRELLDRVFDLEPKAVVFTDIASRYLHLHRERYESLLGAGTCPNYGRYLAALLRRIEVLYGYTLVSGYMHGWSTVMGLVPQGEWPMGRLYPTPETPVGLQIL